MDLGDAAHSFGAPFPEHHAGVWPDVLWVLDEAESAGGLVPCSQVVSVHGNDGGSLPGASTVNWWCCHKIIIIKGGDRLSNWGRGGMGG